MKLCVDCKHFNGALICNHPNNGISPIDGRPNSRFAIVVRRDDKECGEQGIWHEGWPAMQPQSTSWWKSFWSRK